MLRVFHGNHVRLTTALAKACENLTAPVQHHLEFLCSVFEAEQIHSSACGSTIEMQVDSNGQDSNVELLVVDNLIRNRWTIISNFLLQDKPQFIGNVP